MLKKRLFIIGFLLIAIVVLFFVLSRTQTSVDSNYRIKVSTDADMSLYGDSNQFVLIKPKENTLDKSLIRVSNNHVLTFDIKEKKSADASHEVFDSDEHYIVYTYDIDQNFRRKKYDMIAILKKNTLDISGSLAVFMVTYQNRDYLFMELAKNGKSGYYLMDLETEEFSKAPEEMVNRRNGLTFNTNYLNMTHTANLVTTLQRDFGVDVSVSYSTIQLERASSEQLNLSGTNIMEEAPQLVKAFDEGASLYMRSEKISSEEWYNTVIHWFAPQGQDVMELYATDETTGEKTQIKSYADYEAWKATQSGE